MKMSSVVRQLWMKHREFVNSEELKQYCKSMKLDYTKVIKYLVSRRKYLIRIFRGIYYVKSLEELKLGRTKYNHLELVAKGLEMKGVRNWYFGLHSALKLNNMTHEHFVVEEVISDSLFRADPINIAGYKFRFVKISPALVKFGIERRGNLRYSDPEKTILDFAYLSMQKGYPISKISNDITFWNNKPSKIKLRKYVMNYPKTIIPIVEMVIT